MGLNSAKNVSTFGEKERDDQEGAEEALEPTELKLFRSLAARANFLAFDRPDMQYAVKEACRGMAALERRHWDQLKRIARYLEGRPRMVLKYRCQRCLMGPRFTWTPTTQNVSGHASPRTEGA